MAQLPTGTVTFLFTDLESSTRLWEQQREAMQSALARHDELLTEAVDAQGGWVVKGTGDGLHAVFATAEAALAAAVAGQLALSREGWGATGPLRVRMGLHTGTAERRGGDFFGPVLNRAARLMGVAHPGQVLCSQATADLVRDSLAPSLALVDLGEHRLRDLSRPERVFQVQAPGLRGEFGPLASLDAFPGNLPLQVSSFVGRERELARAMSALAESRVVTLTGIGGVGKTRLACQVAGEVLPSFRDGAWLCELAPVRDPAGVVDAVAAVFEVAPRSGQTVEHALVEFLRTKQLLLMLDNCEHVLEAIAALVANLERSCARLVMLLTSREGLGIDGERIFVVPSLSAPIIDAGPDEVAASDAVQLFTERAQAVKSDFAVTPQNAPAVAQICRRLDGMPLAIELAAARIPALNPVELARRLDRRFEFLAGGRRGAVERHQTLRAAIDWSYDLLEEPARRVLARLAVFAGGCTLDASETVCSGEPVRRTAVWELMAGLVAQSLVIAEDRGPETRYRLLETIRQYGEERLDECAETTSLRRRHAEYYVTLGVALSDEMFGPQQLEAAARYNMEQENFSTAMNWAVDTDDVDLAFGLLRAFPGPFQVGFARWPPAKPALGLTGASEHPDYPYALAVAAVEAAFRGDRGPAEDLCEQALTADQRSGPDSEHPVETMVEAARIALAFAVGDWHAAALHSERQVELWRKTGDHSVSSVSTLGFVGAAQCHTMAGDPVAAMPFATEGLALARQSGAPILTAMSLAALASALAEQDPPQAAVLLRESRELSERLNYENVTQLTQAVLVGARLRDRRLALEFARAAIPHLHWRGSRPQLGGVLNAVAWALEDADPEAAATIQGAARALTLAASQSFDAGGEESTGTTSQQTATGVGFLTELRRETTRQLVDALGEGHLREQRQQGALMDIADAVAYTLAHIDETE
jgi:predicted ATPase/class 3 adenylate cyclase